MPHDGCPELREELRDLTCNLRGALDRFRFDARLTDLAEKEMPDARQRLSHVLTLTDAAAHRTLDLVEQSWPLAERTAREAAALAEPWARFRARQISCPKISISADAPWISSWASSARRRRTVRANLAEVLLAQGYQDLTGQIIRGVMTLVAEVETMLADLTRLSLGETGQRLREPRRQIRIARASVPRVPGVDTATIVSDQQDIDALLSDLGM